MISPEYIPITFAALGTLIGALFTWLLLSAKLTAHTKAAAKNSHAEQLRTQEAAENLAKLQQQNQQLIVSEQSLRERQIQLETTLEQEIKTEAEKERIFLLSERRLSNTFKALSAETLKSTQDQFLSLAQNSLKTQQLEASHELDKRKSAVAEMVLPIAQTLEKVQQQISDSEKNRIGENQSLKQQILHITEANQGLQRETQKLVKALRQPIGRGQWGEMQLRRVVEMAGMQEHCDFTTQTTTTTDEGKRLRPDLIVQLPGGQQVIVDSKAPMDAYLEAIETDSDSERATSLTRHAAQVRTHIQQLGSKNYQDQFETTPEFVVLFLPSEAFFSAALTEDSSLIEKGVAQGVILATPTTLIALLRAVSFGWRQETLTENAREISSTGRELYTRLTAFTEHVQKLGRSLNSTVADYNKTVGSLQNRVLTGARKFETLGASPETKELAETQEIETLARQMHTSTSPEEEITETAPNIESTKPDDTTSASLAAEHFRTAAQ